MRRPNPLAQRALQVAFACAFGLAFFARAGAETLDSEVARMMERALQNAETFRKELRGSEYEAKMRVQEWDGSGHLRGTATAHAIMRPGDVRPITFLSREVEGKVRLPDDKKNAKEDDEDKDWTLQQFAREHRISDRFEFTVTGTEEIAGKRARRVSFAPKANQPEKNTADRFLDTITGTAWVSEDENKLVKFEMKLTRPFQLFWIFAVLKDLTIQYELISPGEILGHAKLKVLYALTTPIYSIRQLHDVEIDHFRRRDGFATALR
ncbi:MAG: hypothetical protein M3Y80_09280 [Verrucomicrobiota bacterium]|nr:hypothetical protein [Verrucomicrobiota bacterium]